MSSCSVWQFLSFAAINLHGDAQEYTPLDREILAHLAELNLEEGMYALGSPSPEERADPEGLGADYMARMEGQPYAVLNYQHEWRGDMTPNLLRSLVMNLLTSHVDLAGGTAPTPPPCFDGGPVRAVGLVGFMFFPYSTFIWFKNPDIFAHMMDALVPFSVVGLVEPLDPMNLISRCAFLVIVSAMALLACPTFVWTLFLSGHVRWALAIHGGAGHFGEEDLTAAQEEAYEAALSSALELGQALLDEGASAVDVVEGWCG